MFVKHDQTRAGYRGILDGLESALHVVGVYWIYVCIIVIYIYTCIYI